MKRKLMILKIIRKTWSSQPIMLRNFYQKFMNQRKTYWLLSNKNYAIEAGLIPEEDSIFMEDDNSPYVNVVAVNKEDEENEALHTLVDVLHSDEIQEFIEEEYDGTIVPVSE